MKKPAVAFLIICSYWCCPAFGCNVDEVLLELQEQVTGSLSTQQIADARSILAAHCQAEVTRAVTVAVASAEEQEPPPTLFGIEFRKADEDAPGHDRLKKH